MSRGNSNNRRCGVVLGWICAGSPPLPVRFDEVGFVAECPSCGAQLHQVRRPRPGQRCQAFVPREVRA